MQLFTRATGAEPGKLERSADTLGGLLKRQPLCGLLGLDLGLKPKQFGLLELGDRLERMLSDSFGVQFVDCAIQLRERVGTGLLHALPALECVVCRRPVGARGLDLLQQVELGLQRERDATEQPTEFGHLGRGCAFRDRILARALLLDRCLRNGELLLEFGTPFRRRKILNCDLIGLGALPEHPLQQWRRERRACRQRQGQHEGCRPVGPGRDHASDSTEFVPSETVPLSRFRRRQGTKAAVEAAASAAVGTVYTVPHPCIASRIS